MLVRSILVGCCLVGSVDLAAQSLVFVHDGTEHPIHSWVGSEMLYDKNGSLRAVPDGVEFTFKGLSAEIRKYGILFPNTALTAVSDPKNRMLEGGVVIDWGYQVTTASVPPLQTRLQANPSLKENYDRRILVLTIWDGDDYAATVLSRTRFSLDRRPLPIDYSHPDPQRAGLLHVVGFIYDFEQGIVDANDGSGLDPLIAALLGNDADGVLQLLESKHNPNRMLAEGYAAVHFAATLDNEASTALLSHSSVRLNTQDSKGWQPMHYAAARGNLRKLQLLAGLNRNLVGRVPDRENTPLHLAVSTGCVESVEFLLSAGAEPNPQGVGLTPLYAAINDRRDQMVAIMRPHLRRLSFHRESAAWILPGLIQDNCVVSVSLVLDSTRAQLSELITDTPPVLLAAVQSGTDMLKLLIQQGADVNAVSSTGYSALHIAAASNPTIINWLLEQGLDLEQRNNAGQTPLLVAVAMANLPSVRVLLAAGADPNVVTADGSHILEFAAGLARQEMISALISSGSVCDFNEESALNTMEDALSFDIPELVFMALDQCLPLDFSFPGGFSGWGVAEYYQAHSVLRLMENLELPAQKQTPLRLSTPSAIGYRPQVVFAQLPPYPISLSRIYGNQSVRVQLIIDRNGHARFPRLLTNPIPEMQTAILASAMSFRFTPPELADDIDGVTVILPLRFTPEEDSYAIADLDSPPAPIHLARLPSGVVLRKSGDVHLTFIIDVDGSVDPESVHILESAGTELSELATRLIVRSTFTPGIKDGIPVRTTSRIRIPFRRLNQ